MLPSSYGYYYQDPASPTLTVSPYTLEKPTVGALSNTLQQLWGSGFEYIAFNDEPAVVADNETSPDATTGHTKGVLGWSPTEGKGFWLTHSVPLFPKTPLMASSYAGISSNSFTYGQDLYCVSMTLSELNTLATQLTYNAPDVYSVSVSTATKNSYAGIKNLATKVWPTNSYCGTATIAGHTVFSKTGAWGQDLCGDCVAPFFKLSLYAETWMRGSQCGPFCPPTYTYSTTDVVMLNWGSYSWKETQDHSKWAISTTGSIVCFGDINRMTTQYSRGGGATCVSNPTLWSQMNKAISSHGTC